MRGEKKMAHSFAIALQSWEVEFEGMVLARCYLVSRNLDIQRFQRTTCRLEHIYLQYDGRLVMAMGVCEGWEGVRMAQDWDWDGEAL